ncbi:MAG: protein kinase [Deltaproteobacteria bacterium]|nr:protein kinase [Deltaproteobacteria bacterium]
MSDRGSRRLAPEPFGEYWLLSRIARGGSAEVYLARPFKNSSLPPLPEILVVKRLREELLADEDAQRRFRQEAEIMTRIDSPWIARVFDVGTVGRVPYLSMEYVHGWTLAEIIEVLSKANAPLPTQWCGALVTDLLEGLSALHGAKSADGSSLNLIHRDVNPKNIILGHDGRATLIDLGLGKVANRAWKTQTGAVMGTLGYLSPEQALGATLDLRADLYCAGIVAFELVTLMPLIQRGPVPEMLGASASPIVVAPSAMRSTVSPALDQVILKALSPAPEDRFGTASEMAEAWRRVELPLQDRSAITIRLRTVCPLRDLAPLLAIVTPSEDFQPREPTITIARSAVSSLHAARPRMWSGKSVLLAGVGIGLAAGTLLSFAFPTPRSELEPPGELAAEPAAATSSRSNSPEPPAKPEVRPQPKAKLDGARHGKKSGPLRKSETTRMAESVSKQSAIDAETPIPKEPSPPGTRTRGGSLDERSASAEALTGRALALIQRLTALRRKSGESEELRRLTVELLEQRSDPSEAELDRLEREISSFEHR